MKKPTIPSLGGMFKKAAKPNRLEPPLGLPGLPPRERTPVATASAVASPSAPATPVLDVPPVSAAEHGPVLGLPAIEEPKKARAWFGKKTPSTAEAVPTATKAPKDAKTSRPAKQAKVREPKRARTSRQDFETLTHPGQLPYSTHRKLLLTGHSLFATLDPKRAKPEGFIEQSPRSTVGGLRALLGRRSTPLRIFVDPRIVQRAKTRYAFALDGYLAWGRKHGANSTVLLGGCEQGGTTYLEIYVFTNRMLVEVLERELPSAGAPGFDVGVRTLIEEVGGRYPNVRLFAAAPLPDWGRADIEHIGDTAIRRLTFNPLSAKGAGGVNLRPAVLATATGALCYGGLLAVGWFSYEQAGKQYAREAESPELANAGGINNARLDVMQQRRMFMEAKRPQVALARESKRIAAGIASLPGVRIAELSFRASAAAPTPVDAGAPGAPTAPKGPDPDITMDLIVPAQEVTAMEQAKALMNTISARTGLNLRLSGWSDDDGAGTRKLQIEGFLP